MKILVQWATATPGDWVEVDSSDWGSLPSKSVPIGRESLDDHPGWISAICIQGWGFQADHYHVEDLPGGGVRVTTWSDDSEDWDASEFLAQISEIHPIQPDPELGGLLNTKQIFTRYVASPDRVPANVKNQTLADWNDFVAPTSNVLHGIWVEDSLWEKHREARSHHGWRDSLWASHLDADRLDEDGRVKQQEAKDFYPPDGTKTFFFTTTDEANGAEAAALEKSMIPTSGQTGQNIDTQVGTSGKQSHCYTTLAGEPGEADWPNGLYQASLDVSSATDCNYGMLTISISAGRFTVLDGSTNRETWQQTQSIFSGTGVKVGSRTIDPGSGAEADRHAVVIAATNTGHGNTTLTIDMGANSFAEGPWPTELDLDETLQIDETSGIDRALAFSETLQIDESEAKEVALARSETLQIDESEDVDFSGGGGFTEDLAETLQIDEASLVIPGKEFAETLLILETIAIEIGKNVTETLQIAETIAKDLDVSLAETLQIDEGIAHVPALPGASGVARFSITSPTSEGTQSYTLPIPTGARAVAIMIQSHGLAATDDLTQDDFSIMFGICANETVGDTLKEFCYSMGQADGTDNPGGGMHDNRCINVHTGSLSGDPTEILVATATDLTDDNWDLDWTTVQGSARHIECFCFYEEGSASLDIDLNGFILEDPTATYERNLDTDFVNPVKLLIIGGREAIATEAFNSYNDSATWNTGFASGKLETEQAGMGGGSRQGSFFRRGGISGKDIVGTSLHESEIRERWGVDEWNDLGSGGDEIGWVINSDNTGDGGLHGFALTIGAGGEFNAKVEQLETPATDTTNSHSGGGPGDTVLGCILANADLDNAAQGNPPVYNSSTYAKYGLGWADNSGAQGCCGALWETPVTNSCGRWANTTRIAWGLDRGSGGQTQEELAIAQSFVAHNYEIDWTDTVTEQRQYILVTMWRLPDAPSMPAVASAPYPVYTGGFRAGSSKTEEQGLDTWVDFACAADTSLNFSRPLYRLRNTTDFKCTARFPKGQSAWTWTVRDAGSGISEFTSESGSINVSDNNDEVEGRGFVALSAEQSDGRRFFVHSERGDPVASIASIQGSPAWVDSTSLANWDSWYDHALDQVDTAEIAATVAEFCGPDSVHGFSGIYFHAMHWRLDGKTYKFWGTTDENIESPEFFEVLEAFADELYKVGAHMVIRYMPDEADGNAENTTGGYNGAQDERHKRLIEARLFEHPACFGIDWAYDCWEFGTDFPAVAALFDPWVGDLNDRATDVAGGSVGNVARDRLHSVWIRGEDATYDVPISDANRCINLEARHPGLYVHKTNDATPNTYGLADAAADTPLPFSTSTGENYPVVAHDQYRICCQGDAGANHDQKEQLSLIAWSLFAGWAGGSWGDLDIAKDFGELALNGDGPSNPYDNPYWFKRLMTFLVWNKSNGAERMNNINLRTMPSAWFPQYTATPGVSESIIGGAYDTTDDREYVIYVDTDDLDSDFDLEIDFSLSGMTDETGFRLIRVDPTADPGYVETQGTIVPQLTGSTTLTLPEAGLFAIHISSRYIDVTETLQIDETSEVIPGKEFTETLQLVETIVIEIGKSFSETLQISETVEKDATLARTETLQIDETDEQAKGQQLSFGETLQIDEAAAKDVALGRAETVQIDEAPAKEIGLDRTETLQIDESEDIAESGGFVESFGETLQIDEVIAIERGISRSETLQIDEASAKDQALARTETLQIDETEEIEGAGVQTFAETLQLLETIAIEIGKSFTETIQIDETEAKDVALDRGETLTLTEGAPDIVEGGGGSNFIESFAETIQLVETISKDIALGRTETLDLSEGVAKDQSSAFVETVQLAETVAKERSLAFSELVDLAESHMRSPLSFGETLALTEGEAVDHTIGNLQKVILRGESKSISLVGRNSTLSLRGKG